MVRVLGLGLKGPEFDATKFPMSINRSCARKICGSKSPKVICKYGCWYLENFPSIQVHAKIEEVTPSMEDPNTVEAKSDFTH